MSDQAIVRFAPLRDGRRLSFRAIGPHDGTLVLYLHGAIGSPQHACPELEALAHDLQIRYVMVSRPGFGGSSPAPGRTILSFARDAGSLADHLGRERFAVVGVSAGGPYALGRAHELPERVMATTVVSGMAPGGCCAPARLPLPAQLGLSLGRRCPRTCVRAGDALLAIPRRHPRLVALVMRAGAPPADRRLLADAGASASATARFLAAASDGIGAIVDDYLICTRRWGFRPTDVRGLVHVWHGCQDTLVPVDEAVWLAGQLPHVEVALRPDDGHYFYRRRLREILTALAAAVRAADARVAEAAPRTVPAATR